MPSKPQQHYRSPHKADTGAGVFDRAREAEGVQLSEPLIQKMLDGDTGFSSVKGYLDSVPADESDREYMTSPEQHKNYRSDLTGFISSHLRLVVASNTSSEVRDYLKAVKNAYLNKIAADDATVNEIIDYAAGTTRERASTPNRRRSAISYAGLAVNTKNGTVDLIHGAGLADVSANLHFMDQVWLHWIRWRSDAYMLEKRAGKKPSTDHRVYVNPRIADQPRIFGAIADEITVAGLPVQGKIADHSLDKIAEEDTTRADSLVFYASEEHAEALLKCVHSVYAREQEAFKGRKTVKVGRRVGEGVAIGDDPNDGSGKSLTAHRAQAIEDALNATHAESHLPEDRVRRFQRHLGRIADERGFVANNLSFNKK